MHPLATFLLFFFNTYYWSQVDVCNDDFPDSRIDPESVDLKHECRWAHLATFLGATLFN